MRRTVFALLLMLAVTALAGANQKGHGPRGRGAVRHEQAANDGTHVTANVYFSVGDRRAIRDYYSPRYRSLPPGLRKKVERGGQLPPGWQKKLQPFPVELERRLAPLPREYGRGVIDGHAVIYGTRSHAVIDVAVLF